MVIRQEREEDYKEVYELVKHAFLTVEHCDGDEQDYLSKLRDEETFIPELSLVAEKEGKIVGQIVLYKTDLKTEEGNSTQLVLSPLCVHPDCRGQGFAKALTERACEIAKGLGYKAVFLCGNPEMYSKIGFTPSHRFNVYHATDKDKNADWCMARELVKGSLSGMCGTVDIV